MKVIVNTDHNITLTEESIGAMELLVESTLERTFGRLDQHKGASSMGDIEPQGRGTK